MDERLLEIAERADLVYGALVDVKEFPADVDVTLVEGAVSSEDDLRKIYEVRRNTRMLVSLGDCAVTSNVPGMRNPYGPGPILERAYLENVTINPQLPGPHGPPAARTGAAGARGRQGRRLPARVPAVGRPDLRRRSTICSPGGCPTPRE